MSNILFSSLQSLVPRSCYYYQRGFSLDSSLNRQQRQTPSSNSSNVMNNVSGSGYTQQQIFIFYLPPQSRAALPSPPCKNYSESTHQNKKSAKPLPDSRDRRAEGPNLKFQPRRRFESDRTHIDFSAGRRILLRGTKTISRQTLISRGQQYPGVKILLINGDWHSSLDRSPPRQLSPQ